MNRSRSVRNLCLGLVVLAVCMAAPTTSQELPLVPRVEAQPVVALASRLREALDFIGSRMDEADARKLDALKEKAYTADRKDEHPCGSGGGRRAH